MNLILEADIFFSLIQKKKKKKKKNMFALKSYYNNIRL